MSCRPSRPSTPSASCVLSGSRPTRSSSAPARAMRSRWISRKRSRSFATSRPTPSFRTATPRRSIGSRSTSRPRVSRTSLTERSPDLEAWAGIVERIEAPADRVRVALVGKYVELKDAYISIAEALNHAGIHHHSAVEIKRVDSERIEEEGVGLLADVDGILVAPG